MIKQADYGSIAEKGECTNVSKDEPPKIPGLEDWMSHIPDYLPVSGISIPGTHDSASFTSSWPYVSTQRLTTTQQLDAGIRYFDLRCGLIKDVLEMVHGRAVLGQTLEAMLQDMYTWLKKRPTEALVVQIKQDRKTESSTHDFSDTVMSLLIKDAERWRFQSTTPTLGELRGRIQLFRRFVGKRVWGFGVDVARWPDNPEVPVTIHNANGVRITIQDHYSFSTAESLPSLITKKGGDVANLLVRASIDPNPWQWYINFLSAYEINIWYQIPPREIAVGGYWVFRWVEGINLRAETWLMRNGAGKRFGIVVMDFPELPSQELIWAVVRSNFPGRKEVGWGRRRWVEVTVWVLLMLAAMLGLVALVLGFGIGGSREGRWCSRLLHACSLDDNLKSGTGPS